MRTHIVLPTTLVQEIDTLVGQRKRSAFIQSSVEQQLRVLRQKKAFLAAKGAWKNNPNFQTKEQIEKYIRNSRDSFENRAKRYAQK